jgi:serine/threonine-protein kinase PRP4
LYRYSTGEVLDGRYQVLEKHGGGVFSTVVKAKDLQVAAAADDAAGGGDDAGAMTAGGEYSEVAIKVIRANETMYKVGAVQVQSSLPIAREHLVAFKP